jgi:hypothetical protein
MHNCGTCNSLRAYEFDTQDFINCRPHAFCNTGKCIRTFQIKEKSNFCQNWIAIHMDFWEQFYTKGVRVKFIRKVHSFSILENRKIYHK